MGNGLLAFGSHMTFLPSNETREGWRGPSRWIRSPVLWMWVIFVTRFKLHLATTTDQGATGPSPASGLPLLLTWLESSPISCVRSASSSWNICEGSMANIWARKWCSGVWPFHLYGALERSSKSKLACIGQVSYRAVRVLMAPPCHLSSLLSRKQLPFTASNNASMWNC